MAEKKLIFVLNCSQDYIKHTGEDEEKYAAERSILFESISNTYNGSLYAIFRPFL